MLTAIESVRMQHNVDEVLTINNVLVCPAFVFVVSRHRGVRSVDTEAGENCGSNPGRIMSFVCACASVFRRTHLPSVCFLNGI